MQSSVRKFSAWCDRWARCSEWRGRWVGVEANERLVNPETDIAQATDWKWSWSVVVQCIASWRQWCGDATLPRSAEEEDEEVQYRFQTKRSANEPSLGLCARKWRPNRLWVIGPHLPSQQTTNAHRFKMNSVCEFDPNEHYQRFR